MNHAKKLIVPVLCVLLGGVGVAAMNPVTAQTLPDNPTAQRWQQECEAVNLSGRQERYMAAINATMQRRGAAGWEYVSNPVPAIGDAAIACFKRPAP